MLDRLCRMLCRCWSRRSTPLAMPEQPLYFARRRNKVAKSDHYIQEDSVDTEALTIVEGR